MPKNKKLLFTIIYSLLFIPTFFVGAVEVPDWVCADTTTVPDCVEKIFTWGIGFGAFLAIISFAIGAIMFILPTDKTELKNDGKERMKGAVFGVALLAASFLIMQTINTALVNPELEPLESTEMPEVGVIPGVYFYSTEDCTGYSYLAISAIEKLNTNWKSVKAIDDQENEIFFGVILHKTADLSKKGWCSDFIDGDSGCQKIEELNGAADIVKINTNTEQSGSGLSFYSAPFGLSGGARGGEHKLEPSEVTFPFYKTTASTMRFDWSLSGASKPEQDYCNGDDKKGNFEKCPGSIEIRGDYLVAIYSPPGKEGGKKNCQTFAEDVTNLNAEPITKFQIGNQDPDLKEQQSNLLKNALNKLNQAKTNGSILPADVAELKTLISSLGLGNNYDILNLDANKIMTNIDFIRGKIDEKIKNLEAGEQTSAIDEVIIIPTVGKARDY